MPAGNVFKPRRSLTRQTNPIQQGGPTRTLLNPLPGHPDYVPPQLTYQQQWRKDHGQNPYAANYIKGVDNLDENGQPHPEGYNGMQLLGNPMQSGPRSFNPQNQDVLGRAASALEAIKQDRLNPMGTIANPDAGPVPGSVMSRSNSGMAMFPATQGSRPSPPQGLLSQLMNGAGGLLQQGVNAFQRAYPDQARSAIEQAQSAIGTSQAIDDLVTRSRRDNPMAPPRDTSLDAMDASDEVYNRFQRFQQAAPIPRDSFGAARNARQAYDQVTSGFSNGYNGMLNNPMLSPDQKEQLAEQNARRIVGGGAAADPTNTSGRFGGTYGMQLNADANAIQNGQAVRLADGTVVYHTGTQESARRAQLAGKAEREALRDRSNMNVPQEELDRRAAADAAKAERAAKHQAFKDANGGLSYRQYDRLMGSTAGNNALTMKAVREGRLSPEEANFRMQNRADKALRRAGNPMAMGTDTSRRLFPDMTRGRGGQAPTSAPNPMMQAFEPGALNTPENNALREQMKTELTQTSPTLTTIGVSPDADPNTFAGAVASYTGDLSDEGLVELHNFAKTYAGGSDGGSPFDAADNFMAAPDLMSELWKLPVGTPPSKIREWYTKYRTEVKNRLDKAKQGLKDSPAWTVG